MTLVLATTVDLIPKSKTTKGKINKWDLFIKRLSEGDCGRGGEK